VADTGVVPVIDLNADLAEGDVLTGTDRVLLDLVTSASLACGFHAGNRTVMREAAAACAARGVVIGAHVSYRDRPGFGRRPVDVAPDQLAADVVEQWSTLADEAGSVGATVSYVKPHGALYNAMAVDGALAAVVVEALAPHCAVLVAPPASAVLAPAGAAGVRVVTEGFVDRGYAADGRLLPRAVPGALVGDPSEVAGRARSLAVAGGLVADGGTWLTLEVETLCLHGDHPDAGHHARSVREALDRAGVTVAPFAAPDRW